MKLCINVKEDNMYIVMLKSLQGTVIWRYLIKKTMKYKTDFQFKG